MNLNRNAPMQNNMQVQTTDNYYLFKTLDGNRNVNKLHLNRLIQSMDRNALFTVLIVNENFELIDGQHRLEACKKLGLPVNYIIKKGYGLREVQILNANSKTWNADDYLDGYCDLGYSDYLKYREFKEKYQFGHNECNAILTGAYNNKRTTAFYEGGFKIKDYNEACDIAEKILLMAPYYAGFKRRTFMFTMLGLFKNPNFIFTEFLQKIKLQPTAMVDCSTIEQYKMLIEEIYNYRRREKINLRY